jgi:hypothetical protein
MFEFLTNLFTPTYKSELELYIESKKPQTIEDVEFWTAEFENNQRIINRYLQMGDVTQAMWHRKSF